MRKKKEQELLELEKQKKEHIAPSGWEIIKAEVKNDKLALFSFWLLVVLFAFIIIASFILDEQAIMRVNIFEKYARPSRDGFLLGADAGGRSVLEQLIIGARNSILIGFCYDYYINTGHPCGYDLGILRWESRSYRYADYRLYYHTSHYHDYHCLYAH